MNRIAARQGVFIRALSKRSVKQRKASSTSYEEIEEYEHLRAGNVPVVEIESLDELPDGLIKARIASGLSQKDLAERLHLKEQQIQRYEADRYASASLQRIQQVARAIGVGIRKELLMPLAPTTFNSLVTKLGQAGLDSDFVTSRLLPTTAIRGWMAPPTHPTSSRLIACTADVASRVFGWSNEEAFRAGRACAAALHPAEARFKIPARRLTRATNLYPLTRTIWRSRC